MKGRPMSATATNFTPRDDNAAHQIRIMKRPAEIPMSGLQTVVTCVCLVRSRKRLGSSSSMIIFGHRCITSLEDAWALYNNHIKEQPGSSRAGPSANVRC